MIPSQTLEVFLGAVAALLYAGAVAAIGTTPLLFIGRRAGTSIRASVGLFGLVWLGFVLGQGIAGLVWLGLGLGGILLSSLVWSVCALGWLLACVAAFALRQEIVRSLRSVWSSIWALPRRHAWYVWLGVGVGAVIVLRGAIALLPTTVDDALWVYLVLAKTIATTHTLELQPFVPPNHGLLPLQIELHWAALFVIANETAVTVWDYFCAVSALSGVGLLAWSLTSSRRAAVLAVLMILSSPAFYTMMGGGKTDNATAQYGMAAFLWLTLWPGVGIRSVLLGGLCLGWTLASRYTNVIILPAFMLFALAMGRAFPTALTVRQSKRLWAAAALTGALAVGFAGVPMLIKNWLLVGCPLAPQTGCQNTFWAAGYEATHAYRQNLSVSDLFFYPFVWTFGSRADMLGNISPLFIGFFPFFLASYHSPVVQRTVITGLAGLSSIGMWLLIKPFILYTRWLLIPLELLAIPLSAAVVAAEQDLSHRRAPRWLVGSAVSLVLLYLLFQSRAVVYAVRYVASVDSPAVRYESMPGYDIATWLNTHVQPGQRVAFGGSGGYYPYFVEPAHLLSSESAEELQWLWERYERRSPAVGTSDFWRFYLGKSFTYVVVSKDRVADALSTWPSDIAKARPKVAFVGRTDAVLKIEEVSE